MKFPPSNEDTCHAADIIDLSVVCNMKEILPQDHDNLIEHILYQLHETHEDDDNPTLFTANSIDDEKPTPKLKELTSHLEYAFLDNNRELPVIISSLLSDQEKRSLLEVLTKHKKALAWKISDIKGISPSFCTHKILMEENSKPTGQPQRRLNSKVQDIKGGSLLLQECDIKIKDKNGTENLAADHLLDSKLQIMCFPPAPRIQKLRGNSRDRLDSYSFGNFAEIAAVTA
ncbi:hypothetical protein Tco_0576038 [Tanacetum coccineum]